MNSGTKNILYDICNFSMIGLCFFAIIYCLFVKIEDYNYFLLLTILISAIGLGLGSDKLKMNSLTKFSKLSQTITFNVIKETIDCSLTFISFVLIFLVVLYPITEFIHYIMTWFPVFWPDKFQSHWITNFAVKYLPYAFHPNCSGFSFFIVNIFMLMVAGFVLNLKNFFLYAITGLTFIYALFDEQFFDWITDTFFWFTIVAFILVGLYEAGKNGNFSTSGSFSAGSVNNAASNNTYKSYSSSTEHITQMNQNNITNSSNTKQKERFIGSVVQNGNSVLVYDEKGSLLFSRQGILKGYTATTISVKINGSNNILTYSNKGSLLYSRLERN